MKRKLLENRLIDLPRASAINASPEGRGRMRSFVVAVLLLAFLSATVTCAEETKPSSVPNILMVTGGVLTVGGVGACAVAPNSWTGLAVCTVGIVAVGTGIGLLIGGGIAKLNQNGKEAQSVPRVGVGVSNKAPVLVFAKNF